MGLSCRIDGQYERAIDAYRRAIELDPTYADAYNNLGNIYLLQKRYHEAIKLYQQDLRYHPSDALFHYNLGACYELVGEQKKAKAKLSRARKLDPTLEQRMRRAAFDESTRRRERLLPIILKGPIRTIRPSHL